MLVSVCVCVCECVCVTVLQREREREAVSVGVREARQPVQCFKVNDTSCSAPLPLFGLYH